MKDSNYKELISYASSFVSFVLPKIDVEEVILFGSVARKEPTKESDVDIFFNVINNEKIVKKIITKELSRFYKSRAYETFSLKGIKNPIKIEVGNLDKWKLKRSIISEGIILYGKYKEIPDKTKGYTYFNLVPIKNITKRNRVIRNLFGRKEKNYYSESIVKKSGGKQLSPTSFIVPINKASEIISILNSEKVDHTFFEFWSDQVL